MGADVDEHPAGFHEMGHDPEDRRVPDQAALEIGGHRIALAEHPQVDPALYDAIDQVQGRFGEQIAGFCRSHHDQVGP
ncbi:hypothetical protein GCM10017083_46500 [Thalassobaculum fulvum]|uniref:Uncharacterized protein n=1 Tax=Thalassobaculum fulvum TaxID=1633335 RepID=A0A918XXI7_9PROT|nr:hypothetical protein GCM10017083_46500 [Thalassobaculum fulvum]